MTTPTIEKGSDGAVWIGSGVSAAVTNKAMAEVDLSSDLTEARPRYSVWEVVDPLFRHLDDAVTPVFQYKLGGTGSWLTIPGVVRVEPQDVRVFLATPLASADTVQMTSANVITPAFVAGVERWQMKLGWNKESKIFLQDTSKRTIPKNQEWTVTAKLAITMACAQRTTALGTNKDITYTHTIGGLAGNDVSVTYGTPGASPLSIAVVGTDVTVTLNTASTARQLVELWNNNAVLVKDLGVRADLKTGETGAGTLVAMTHTHLSGGANPVDFTNINGAGHNVTAVCTLYEKFGSDRRWSGYCTIPQADMSIGGDAVNGVDITFETRGGQNGEIVWRGQ
jgi:hypothetical protein